MQKRWLTIGLRNAICTDVSDERNPPGAVFLLAEPMHHSDDPALEHRRKRLAFRAWHRGTRETDLILGRFSDASVSGFDETELSEFERILEMPDPDIFSWVTGVAPVPTEADTALLKRLIAFHNAKRTESDV